MSAPPGHTHEAGISELTGRLRRSSHKVTAPREAILQALRDAARPLTTREILAALPGAGCDLATVYRSTHLLEEMGIVQRVDFGDGSARFELMEGEHSGHHHHLICTGCRAVQVVGECLPIDLERRIAARSGFRAVTHRLEFFGLCPRCQRPA
jgi:Fur family ferric uptake transcriptional regulator